MKCWQEYIAYLKDNPEGYWFKRKLYGFGWVPAKRQGWMTLGFYLLFVLGLTIVAPTDMNDSEVIKYIIGPVVGATLLMLVISWKTGEPLKWQWGRKHDKK